MQHILSSKVMSGKGVKDVEKIEINNTTKVITCLENRFSR